MKGKLFVIGFGPGSFEHITKRARDTIAESDVVIGYNTYVDLIRGLMNGQEVVRTGMTEEVSRAQEAVRQAEMGKKVAVISSGDAGVYGMAGLIYEVLVQKGWSAATGVEVEVVPGISAINSTASLLGAPIMHDACTISLSDHLTPWAVIEKRIEAAASADFVIALYNPRSGRRTRQIVEAQRIMLQHRSADTPVGIVKSAYRDREQVVITTLAQMLEHDIGMLTTVVIGNSTTFLYDGLMITPRGYQRKYTLDADVQPLKPHMRLRKDAEPWALEDEEADVDLDAYEEDDLDAYMEESWHAETEADERSAADSDGDLEWEEEDDDALGDSHLAVKPGNKQSVAVGSYGLALEALQLVKRKKGEAVDEGVPARNLFVQESILEFAVSPGVVNKKITAAQMLLIAEAAGERGEIEYSTQHQLILRVPTSNPETLTRGLREAGLLLMPLGDVAQLKACDFCNGEKDESIPYAEQLAKGLNGRKMPKELKIGFNGCGMACYGAVNDDIGIIYRRGKFDLFLGAKPVGRNAHSGQPVAEGIKPERLIETIERIVAAYSEGGYPNERFYKYFKRVGKVAGYSYREVPMFVIEDAACGD
ncbi:precorrin-3B C(17)-methyltransferase [Paenibacillus oenotherae]|uniref:Precorrin-3B C(17)-methyltransferase n=1 Tax=Paenibacillus oenotherae TaxID=1435645 RepID=A0ABS7D442_9BACL|nr:precorrin-3B C(17)-methyltransferase [Paenibacillus oenotherae]MBW7474342.1 precorrin-3B C(17)-methyltransferase [Paenibacillus oenotherae]